MKPIVLMATLFLVHSSSLGDSPVNDLFANRIPLAGAEVGTSPSNRLAGREPGEPAHNESDSGNSVWWTWTAPANGWFSITTAGSDFDTVLAVYSGSTLSSLTLVGWNDDLDTLSESDESLASRVRFLAEAGVSYSIAVEGYYDDEDTDLEWGSIRLQIAPGSENWAPSWSLSDLDGHLVSSTNFAGGVVLVEFWDPAQPTSLAQIPALLNLEAKYRGLGLGVVGMALSESGIPSLKLLVDQYGITYPTFVPTSAVAAQFNDIGIQYRNLPTTFIINRAGVVVGREFGARTEVALEALIAPLIGEQTNLPVLTARRREGTMVLSWRPADLAPVLERSERVTGQWIEFSPPRETANGVTEVTLPASGEGEFFRLRR